MDDAETEEAKKRRKAAKKKSRQKMTEQEKEAAEIFGTSVLRMVNLCPQSTRFGVLADMMNVAARGCSRRWSSK